MADGEKDGGSTGPRGEPAPFDNFHLTLYARDRYGVDMTALLQSLVGTLPETQAKLVKQFFTWVSCVLQRLERPS